MNYGVPSAYEPKFTRGEKCIFGHVIFTFVLILLLIIIFIIHLITVQHRTTENFIVRKSMESKGPTKEATLNNLVGVVFLDIIQPRIVCNSVLIKPLWSLSTAHCVATRTDPRLSNTLPYWTVMYFFNNLQESVIKRSIPHPHFDGDDYSNNLGIIEHAVAIKTGYYVNLKSLGSFKENDMVRSAGWPQLSFILSGKSQAMQDASKTLNDIQLLPSAKCEQLLSPINNIKEYELCGIREEIYPNCLHNHVLAIFAGTSLIGLSSWGEKCQGKEMPLVFTKVGPFLKWIEEVTSLYDKPYTNISKVYKTNNIYA